MKYEVHKLPYDIKSLQRLAEAQGWKCEKTALNHLKWTSPDGKIAGHSGTPSDHRAINNFRAMLKRYGLRPYMPLKEEKKLEDPKPVISKVAGDSTLPVSPIPPVGAKTTRAGKGALENAVMTVMRELNAPEGSPLERIVPLVVAKMPGTTSKKIGQALHNYVHRNKLVRVATGIYRLPGPVAAAEDDDIQVLEEALATLAKLERVVKKLKLQSQQLQQAKTLLNSIK